MEKKQKLLICGDVNGNFKQLFNRLENINKKSGPFELLLCIGNFFNKTTTNDELQAYINGNKRVTVPTYILGANSSEVTEYYEQLTNGEICSNLTYLGGRGLYIAASGIKIAYLSGIEQNTKEKQNYHFNDLDVKAVRNFCIANKTSMGEYRGVDILITSQWPLGICPEKELNTSKLISWLANEIKPRYHFCGLNGIYYERLPYRNSGGKITQLELSTRFISLASVGNVEKQKHLYAMSIQSVDSMRMLELIQKTTNETTCPYDSMDLMKEVGLKCGDDENNSTQFFYDIRSFNQNNRTNDNGGPNRRRRGGGFGNNDNNSHQKRPKATFDQEKCWFCVSSATVEKQLIITIGEHFYLAIPKGPLNQFHCLILPVTHIQSSSLLSKDSWDELIKFKTALKNMFADENKVVTFFERNYKSSHLQINAVAIEKHMESQIKTSFDDVASSYRIQLDNCPPINDPADLPDQGPYFLAELPNMDVLLTRKMSNFPLNFGREPFCTADLLNSDEKIDWKDCLLNPDDEILYVKYLREKFTKYDFTQ